MIRSTLLSTLFFAVTASYANATCFEDRYVPEQVICSAQKDGHYADFTKGGCRISPGYITQTEVECPGKWYNVAVDTHKYPTRTRTGTREFYGDYHAVYTPNPAYSHAQLCALHGLKPATINGSVCASGRSRPKSGAGVETINYIYGTDSSSRSGSSVSTRAMRTCNYHQDSCTVDANTDYYYTQCGVSNSRHAKDAVVAVACQP